MKRVLLVGNSPLPNDNVKSRPAAGLRTHQFLTPLLTDHIVRLITIAMPECYEGEVERKEIHHSEKFSQIIISKNDPGLIREVQALHDEFRPDVIIGVNTYPSHVASQLKFDAPFWADLNGWIMAEGQAQAYKMGSNDYIPHYMKLEEPILEKADKISAVSDMEKYALIGELAGMGRLNKESFGYEFVEHIPNGTEWFNGELEGELDYKMPVPDDAFVLLWMGGYNTWVDEVLLFRGVEAAMEACPNLYYVSTGGEIAGLDNKTFAAFKTMIDQSEYKERFVFLGWVDTKEIPYIYKRADVGLNVDIKCTETVTGARNRINEMMKFGLPVITTLGSEISYEVGIAGAGIGVPSGKAPLLAEAIVKMFEGWRGGGEHRTKEFLDIGQNAAAYIEQECNYQKTLAPLLKWIENPRPAPDRGVKLDFGGMGVMKSAWKYLKANGVKKSWDKLWQRLKR